MLFQKYYFKSTPDSDGQPVEDWYMILRSIEDILQYNNLDVEKYTRAFIALPEAMRLRHPGGREGIIYTVLNIKAHSTPENEKFQPLLALSEFLDKKAQGMVNTFLKYGPLRVNEVGGYSPLDSYVDFWKCELVQEIEKDGLGFPKDDNTTFETEVVILENDKSAKYFSNKLRKDLNLQETDLIYVINHLKERDASYIVEMCSKSKNIAIDSCLIDQHQVDKMMKLFTVIPSKNVYLRVFKEEDTIKNHKLYPELNKLHNIIFIN